MRLREEMPNLIGISPCINEQKLHNQKKLTFIHVWSISCNDCKKQMPSINKLKNEFEQELQVISIHMPRSEADKDEEEVQKVVRMFELTEPILLDNEHKLTSQLNTRYVPSYYIFDKNNKLRYFQSSKGWRLLRNRIMRLLRE